jgi:hypothetical protein
MLRRRELLRRSLAVGGAFALGCRGKRAPPACTDVTGLSPDDVRARETLLYVDRAADPARSCDRCAQFLEAPRGCGGCRTLRGPISPAGSCKVFAAKG